MARVDNRGIRRLAEQRGWTITEVYCDRLSGANRERPALNRLLADARRGTFSVVMVWRFDRLSRSALHFLEVIEELRTLGVDFISHEQSLDTTTAMNLTWIGKDAVVRHHQDVPFRVMKADSARSHGDPGTGNLLVQGDNLVALKALLPYYAGQGSWSCPCD